MQADGQAAVWTPPSSITELFAKTAGNKFAAINAPTSGVRHEAVLPEGTAPVQLYSLATPNGNKVSILFEELEELGVGFSYDAFMVDIGKGEQFGSGFVGINPNSKIPCVRDKDGPDGQPIDLFESGSICMYFVDKFSVLGFQDNPRLRQEMMNWIFWQMGGQGPITGACFGHFFVYAPEDQLEARDYGCARYGMEVMRQCHVLETHLAQGDRTWLVGDQYSLADIMIFPWFHQLRVGYPHKSGLKANEFLNIPQYTKLNEWADRMLARGAVQRGVQVCSWSNPTNSKPWK